MKNRLKLYFLLTIALSVFLPVQLMATDDCSGCHEKTMAKSRRGRVVHAPVMKGQCRQCHIAGQIVSAPIKKSTTAIEKKKSEKIRWFKTLSSREQEHWVRLPADSVKNTLFLKASDGRMRTPVEKVSLPKQGLLPKKSDDGTVPQQSDLRVTDVRRGISTTATLQWETDEFTESVIHYGIDSLRSVKSDRRLARQHSQVMLGLESDKAYQYQVVSRDLFGNEVKSSILTFSTAKSFWNQDASYNSEDPYATAVELSWELSRIGDDYLLVVTADRPVSVTLGEENVERSKTKDERKVATGAFSHPVLKSALDTNITVCKACHQELREEYSHPIKVRARKGMIIPQEYPVLADGTMSCMTCHDSHASDHEHRLRKSKKADLCRGCHRNY